MNSLRMTLKLGCVTLALLAATLTVQAQSYPDRPVRIVSGLLPGTSGDIAGDIVELLKRSDVKEALDKNYFELQGKNADEFRKVIKAEGNKWRQVITAANIKIE